MKKVAIQTLTYNHDSRIESLSLTFKTFYNNYNGIIIDWYILINGYNKRLIEVVEDAKRKYSDKFNIFFELNNENLGVGVGLNILNTMCNDYEYTFLLEDDWVCIPNYMSGHSENWFWNSINLLDEKKDISQIHYRRYLDDLDDRQYGYSYWININNIKEEFFNGDVYFIFHMKQYTNNPSLRRMSSLYEKGILPLDEFWNGNEPLEIKGKDQWGMAEINAMDKTKLDTAWLYLGNFVHFEDWVYKDNFEKWKNDNFGCGVYNMSGWNTCKYGYLFPGHYFCGVCEKEQDISHLESHSHIYLQEILPLEHKKEDNNIILNKIKNLVKNPTIDSENYINEKIYLNDRYYRGK